MAGTLPISADAVTERINAMRIAAEHSLASVQAYAVDNAQALAKVVVGYRSILANTGSRIIQFQVRVIQALAADPTNPTLIALQRRSIELLTAWTAHAQGYMPYERPATDAEKGNAVSVGFAPAVVIALAVAGAVIAVSLTGIAWAVVHYKEAQTLSDEVALVERDPSLADALAKLNQTSPSSSPANDPNPDKSGGWGWFVAALGIAGAAIFIVPKLGKG